MFFKSMPVDDPLLRWSKTRKSETPQGDRKRERERERERRERGRGGKRERVRRKKLLLIFAGSKFIILF